MGSATAGPGPRAGCRHGSDADVEGICGQFCELLGMLRHLAGQIALPLSGIAELEPNMCV